MKTQAKPKLKLTKRARKEELQFFAYISPWLIGFLLFTVVPLFASVAYAFFDFTKVDLAMGNELKFVGFRNFCSARTHTFGKRSATLSFTHSCACLWVLQSVLFLPYCSTAI